jgi:eukaryotic-like serine/threonine-protein kinase
MTPERWQQIKAVLEKALETPFRERTAFLEQACSDDAEMRKEVDSLLKSNEEARSGFLDSAIPPITLTRGSKLGEYEVRALVGSGGMGEVYRARDTRLGRDVAIKVLPPYVSSDKDRLRRFEQEAQATAALNHPNILSVYQFGSYEGAPYLVTELLEGETLRELIRRGPIAQRKAIDMGTQIAQGLAAAHNKGIVHRDLKPENLFITKDGRVKILDFGLAKLIAPELSHDSQGATETEPGMILGTASYMAPEQVRGQGADNRSDLFAFGAILYEMLSGTRAFRGQTPADTMSAILKEDPPLLPEGLAPALPRIVRRCLEKNPEQRFQSASDLGFALEAVTTMSDTSSAQIVNKQYRPRIIVVAGSLILAGSLAAIFWLKKTAPSNQNVSQLRFSVGLPANDSLGEYVGSSVALSKDGTKLAYVVNHGTERSIFIRPLNKLQGVSVAGTERGSAPFFSPDGEWLGFAAEGKLKRVSVGGGQPQTLCDIAVMPGATWGPDDTIVYSPNFNVGLFAISGKGGKPRRLTTPKNGEFHFLPDFLPGGKEVLFTIWNGTSSGLDESKTAVLSLDTGKIRVIMEGGWSAKYAPNSILYIRGDSLLSVPFDWERARAIGPPEEVATEIWKNLYVGVAYLATASNGTLAYVSGGTGGPQRSLVWVNRSGERQIISSARHPYSAPRLSPDGQRIAMWVMHDIVANIWTYDPARDTFGRLTFFGDDHTVAWSPNGKQVAFESSRNGPHQLFLVSAEGGDPTQLTSGNTEHYLCDWSPDGRRLAYVDWNLESGADLWTIDLDSRESRPIANSRFNEKQGTFSPDGHWIAFTSNEAGQNEVYVQAFPGTGPKRQVSSGGGEEPAWSHSGKELFYRLGGQVFAVPMTEEKKGEMNSGKPKRLFQGLFNYTITFSRSYDVGPDGRLLMVAEPDGPYAPRQVDLVVNARTAIE